MSNEYMKCACKVILPYDKDELRCPLCGEVMSGPVTVQELLKDDFFSEDTDFTEADMGRVVEIKEDCIETVVINSDVMEQLWGVIKTDIEAEVKRYVRDRKLVITAIDEDDSEYGVVVVPIPMLFSFKLYAKKSELVAI